MTHTGKNRKVIAGPEEEDSGPSLRLLPLLFFLVCTACLLSGCGLMFNRDTDEGAAAADAGQNAEESWDEDPVSYTTNIRVEGDVPGMESRMRSLSQLVQLAKEKPDGMLALERRAIQDQETADKLMQSECYYDGKATYSLDQSKNPVVVTLTLVPGIRFKVGEARVIYQPKPVVPEAFRNRVRVTGFWGLEKTRLPPPAFPDEIPGVTIGEPIAATDMLKAVEAIPQSLKNNGYPLAKLKSSEYTLDKPAHLLNAKIVIDPGPPAVMGEVIIKGEKEVNASFLRKLVPWEPGKEAWDSALLESYANRLRGMGLFRSVEVKPDIEGLASDTAHEREGAALLPAVVEVQEGPWRSLSFNARYDTDTGFGVEGIWENRNLFHNGEKLRLDAPISLQEYGLKAHFEKPAFLERGQMFYADGSALREETDAYNQTSVKGEAGIIRQLARNWYGGVSLFAEGGSVQESGEEEKAYGIFSPRAGVRYDGRNNRLNPSSGAMVDFRLKPFTGYYESEFGGLAGTLALTGYYAPLGRKADGEIDNTIVLAARAEGGAMPASSPLEKLPPQLRYYTGGAGSVRGYTYQSIGPRNSDGDPKGGRSFQVVNLESRFMVTENIGIVPFLDGGMVYSTEFPEIIGDMDWGTGLGFRYYTPIGPVRLDVATPLHRIDDDPPVQVYISIGQSF